MKLSHKNQQFPSRPLTFTWCRNQMFLLWAESILREIQPSLSLKSLPVKQSLWRLCWNKKRHQLSAKHLQHPTCPCLFYWSLSLRCHSSALSHASSHVRCCSCCCCSRHHGVLLLIRRSSPGIQVIEKETKSRKCWIGQLLWVVFSKSLKSGSRCGHKLLSSSRTNPRSLHSSLSRTWKNLSCLRGAMVGFASRLLASVKVKKKINFSSVALLMYIVPRRLLGFTWSRLKCLPCWNVLFK